MKNIKIYLLLASFSFALSGCGLTTYNKVRDSKNLDGSSKSYFIDAQQRVVTVSSHDKNGEKHQRICAEPSPDAISAASASGGLSINVPSGTTADAKAAFTESVASIGLRTQSIQLLRDAMYRLCEAYQSGAIDDISYETMTRRFQTSMVAVLAIEQLTGAVKASGAILEGNAGVGSPQSLERLTVAAANAANTLSTVQQAALASKMALDGRKIELEAFRNERLELSRLPHVITPPAMPSAAQMTQITRHAALQGLISTAERDVTSLESTYSTRQRDEIAAMAIAGQYEESRRSAAAGNAYAGATAQVFPSSSPVVSGADLAAVAETVAEIVKSSTERTFSDELCVTILGKEYRKNNEGGNNAIVEKCFHVLATQVVANSTAEIVAETIIHSPRISADDVIKLIDSTMTSVSKEFKGN